MSGYNEKAIRIVQFSGKKEDWQMWHRQFLAMAGKKKYKDVLLGTVKVPDASESLDPAKTGEDKKIKRMKLPKFKASQMTNFSRASTSF